MHRRTVQWACVVGLFCLQPVWAASQPNVAGDAHPGNNQQHECMARCAEAAKLHIGECLAAGGDDRDCLAIGRQFQTECERDCRNGKSCEERCEKKAKRARRQCLADGGDEDRCNLLARQAHQDCLQQHCPPPPPTCEDECERRATAIFHECIEQGIGEDECAMRARMLLRHCIDENCPPPGCKERCEQDARHVYRMCIEMGGSEDDCAKRAREHLKHCIAAHCPNADCEDHCARRAFAAYKECVEEGGDEDQCAQHARELYNTCIEENCSNNISCDERCRRFAAGIKRMCLDMGGSEEDCEARAQEALEQCLADCPARCGGITGIPCDYGEFCQFPPGTCQVSDNMGVCQTVPAACPDVWEPVCGCDGKTYGNRCEAAMAMASIDHVGECEPLRCGDGYATPTHPPSPCPDGYFCHFPPGTCDVADDFGICQPIPDVCPRIFDPVCGCDGVTYANRCEAAAAKQSIKHEGPCEDRRCGGIAGFGCDDDGKFCKYATGTCGCCDIFGVCTEFPLGCPDNVDPVCGCDGETYFNTCEADVAGASILHYGPCTHPCDGNENCRHDQYCHKRIGLCDAAVPGVCETRPQFCPEYYQPVCGCDGQTYSNICFAAGAGVSVAHEGQCED